MGSNVEKVRLWVFKVWFFTLAVVLVAYGSRYTGLYPIKPAFSAIFQSFQMMVGLILPQIGVMIAFYLNLDRQGNKIDSLSEGQVTIIIWLSVTYHFLFIMVLIAGVGFGVFDQKPDGNSLERNTSAIIAIMGLFSVFITPVAFLFSKPSESEDVREGNPAG